MMSRKRIRELALACRVATHGNGVIFGKPVEEIAEALSTPLWFSAADLRLAADAMDILSISQADAWTLRARLDEFDRSGPLVKNAGGFAAYLKMLPNGGVQ